MIPTPYDGSSPLFQIGVKPLDPADWIDIDDHLLAHLAQKRRILAAYPDRTIVAQADSEAAQCEVLALLASHLPARFPDIYRRAGGTITILPADLAIDLDAAQPPLVTAASLVQEDLVVMRKGETGWRLAAAVLAFPSSWTLLEKFGRPMDVIHAPRARVRRRHAPRATDRAHV